MSPFILKSRSTSTPCLIALKSQCGLISSVWNPASPSAASAGRASCGVTRMSMSPLARGRPSAADASPPITTYGISWRSSACTTSAKIEWSVDRSQSSKPAWLAAPGADTSAKGASSMPPRRKRAARMGPAISRMPRSDGAAFVETFPARPRGDPCFRACGDWHGACSPRRRDPRLVDPPLHRRHDDPHPGLRGLPGARARARADARRRGHGAVVIDGTAVAPTAPVVADGWLGHALTRVGRALDRAALLGMRLAWADVVQPAEQVPARLDQTAQPYLDPVLQREPRRFFAFLDRPAAPGDARILDRRDVPHGEIVVHELATQYEPFHASESWPCCVENARVPFERWTHA